MTWLLENKVSFLRVNGWSFYYNEIVDLSSLSFDGSLFNIFSFQKPLVIPQYPGIRYPKYSKPRIDGRSRMSLYPDPEKHDAVDENNEIQQDEQIDLVVDLSESTELPTSDILTPKKKILTTISTTPFTSVGETAFQTPRACQSLRRLRRRRD